MPSPYTSNSIDVAVESGDDEVGSWVTEEQNIYEDYRKFFGEEPPALGAMAMMTDTDDSQDEATAFYGDITLVSSRQQQTAAAPSRAWRFVTSIRPGKEPGPITPCINHHRETGPVAGDAAQRRLINQTASPVWPAPSPASTFHHRWPAGALFSRHVPRLSPDG